MKDSVHQRVKANDLQWFRENTTDNTYAYGYFQQATRYNHQELMFLLIEKYGAYMRSRAYPYFPMYNYFLHPTIDARSMAIILAFFPCNEYVLNIAEYPLAHDNLAAFAVLYRYCMPRLREVCGGDSFKTKCFAACLRHDAVRCFSFLRKTLVDAQLCVSSKSILDMKAYKIQRYHHIEDSVGA